MPGSRQSEIPLVDICHSSAAPRVPLAALPVFGIEALRSDFAHARTAM